MSSSPRTPVAGLLAFLVGGAGAVACIDAPRLATYEEATAIAANMPPAGGTDPAHPGMVFVPGLSIDVPGAVTPTAVPTPAPAADKAGEEGKGKGKGKDGGGDDDKGAPTPPGGEAPPPEDAATTPPAVETAPSAHLEVAGFWLDAREVSVEAFRSCVAAGGCTAAAAGDACTMAAGLDQHPVNCVTVEQARGYCTWQRKRLVRDEEWTAAAAGSAQRLFPWGAAAPAADRLNACGAECAAAGMYAAPDGHVHTAPTGSFPLGRTPEGVDDLAGNVAEWVEGPAAPLARGGSFADVDVSSVRSLEARSAPAAGPSVGFRCAVSP